MDSRWSDSNTLKTYFIQFSRLLSGCIKARVNRIEFDQINHQVFRVYNTAQGHIAFYTLDRSLFKIQRANGSEPLAG